jgi:hypothetical protein
LDGVVYRHIGQEGHPVIGTEPMDAEALFGSAARQDGDILSDVDYLVVGNNHNKLRARKQWLTRQGFSVSDYTWKRLERSFENQTLFALHLAVESRPVLDRTGRLRDLFASYKPKTAYDSDFDDSLQLFRPLERVPASSQGRAWALDVLAVAFRNSAILQLAEQGRYVFSMRAIVEELTIRGRINREQSEALRSLRTYKARYRADVAGFVSREQLDRPLRAVQAGLLLDFECVDGTPQDLISTARKSTDAYARMRSMEAELISAPQSVLSNPEAAQLRSDLLRNTRDPHTYLWTFLYNAEVMEDNLARFRSFY